MANLLRFIIIVFSITSVVILLMFLLAAFKLAKKYDEMERKLYSDKEENEAE